MANDIYQTADRQAVELGRKSKAVPTTLAPHQWKDVDLAVCMNDCSSPTICIQTGSCRCVQADNCVSEDRNPIAPATTVIKSKYIHITTNDDFAKAVERISWKSLLLPEARRVIDEFPHFIKVHVVTGYEGEADMESKECHKLGEAHCFSADSILYQAMRKISVVPEEADLIILPAYQQCEGGAFLLHTIHAHAEKTIPNFESRAKSVVLTHDWGVCINFAWNIWEGKQDNHLKPDGILDNTMVWSVQGDSNTKCYRPHQDVVIPARTCNTDKLRQHFGDSTKITPAAQRTLLITWSGELFKVCDRDKRLATHVDFI